MDVVACDVCHRSPEFHRVKVDHVEVRLGEARGQGDLCEEHAAPVRAALQALQPVRRRKPRRYDDVVLEETPPGEGGEG